MGSGLEVDKLTDSTINKKSTADLTPLSDPFVILNLTLENTD
jgi:hypothetical protein